MVLGLVHTPPSYRVRLGKVWKVFPGAVIGAIPQDLKYKGENSTVVIGDNVIIRECCTTLNRGTEYSMTTKIGLEHFTHGLCTCGT